MADGDPERNQVTHPGQRAASGSEGREDGHPGAARVLNDHASEEGHRPRPQYQPQDPEERM